MFGTQLIDQESIAWHIRTLGKKWKVLPAQVEIIANLLEAFKKHDDVILEAPTGIGKSLIGVTVASFFDSAYLVTAERLLQQQYAQDFRCDMLMGADNYACVRFGATAATAPCKSLSALKRICGDDCEYFSLRRRAQWSKLLLTNYHYLALEFDYVKVLPPKHIAIFDEAHNAESILYDYAAVGVTDGSAQVVDELLESLRSYKHAQKFSAHLRILEKLLKSRYARPCSSESIGVLAKHFESFYRPLRDVERAIRAALDTVIAAKDVEHLSDSELSRFRQSGFFRLFRAIWNAERHVCKWENYTDNAALDWIIEQDASGSKLIPTTVGFYSSRVLQAAGSKRLWMSATIGSPKLFSVAHALTKPKVFQLESPFPAENRKVFLVGNFRVNQAFVNDKASLQALVATAAAITTRQSGRNGIIHSGTYALTRELSAAVTELIPTHQLHLHELPADRDELVSAFLRDGGILVSPTIIQGLDFKDDASRFQIILKVPYLSLTSRLIQWKLEHDPDWYANKAAIQVIQALGRSIRHHQDYAVSYILDRNVLHLVKYFPKWLRFRDAKGTKMIPNGTESSTLDKKKLQAALSLLSGKKEI